MEPLHFLDTDLNDRPRPGWYCATVVTACWRCSSNHHRMVYVVVVVDGLAAPYACIGDYFVLEGVTPQGIACSRRRLVSLFRAGGLVPQAGDEIRPELLAGLRVDVELAHETWKGKLRLQLKAYRTPSSVTQAPDAVQGASANGEPARPGQDHAHGQ